MISFIFGMSAGALVTMFMMAIAIVSKDGK